MSNCYEIFTGINFIGFKVEFTRLRPYTRAKCNCASSSRMELFQYFFTKSPFGLRSVLIRSAHKCQVSNLMQSELQHAWCCHSVKHLELSVYRNFFF